MIIVISSASVDRRDEKACFIAKSRLIIGAPTEECLHEVQRTEGNVSGGNEDIVPQWGKFDACAVEVLWENEIGMARCDNLYKWKCTSSDSSFKKFIKSLKVPSTIFTKFGKRAKRSEMVFLCKPHLNWALLLSNNPLWLYEPSKLINKRPSCLSMTFALMP